MVLVARENGREVWATYNLHADDWELYADRIGVSYLGNADNLYKAKLVARDWFREAGRGA